MNTITVIEKKPGEQAHTRQIENTLEAFQEAVGGYIETVTVASDMAIVCNEEGRLRGAAVQLQYQQYAFRWRDPVRRRRWR